MRMLATAFLQHIHGSMMNGMLDASAANRV